MLEFLKFCVQKGCTDKSVHNYLLAEYIKFDSSQIMKYLTDQKEVIDNYLIMIHRLGLDILGSGKYNL